MKKTKSDQSSAEAPWLTVQDFCAMYAQDQGAWLFRPSTDGECQRIVGVSVQDGSVRLLSSTKFARQPFMFRKIGLSVEHVRAGAGEVYEVWATSTQRQSGSKGRKKRALKRTQTHPIGYFYFNLAALEKRLALAPVIALSVSKHADVLELDPLEMALDFPNTQTQLHQANVDV